MVSLQAVGSVLPGGGREALKNDREVVKGEHRPCHFDHLWIVLLEQGQQSLHCLASVDYILRSKQIKWITPPGFGGKLQQSNASLGHIMPGKIIIIIIKIIYL